MEYRYGTLNIGMEFWYGLLVWNIGVMKHWYGILVWDIGMEYWYGTLVWNIGMEYWWYEHWF